MQYAAPGGDIIEVEAQENSHWGGGVLDNLTSVEIRMDITAPSEASFEVGDDGTFAEIAQALGPGQRYVVRVNRRALVSGRIEARDAPVDARAGAAVRFTVRSWLADAMVTGARPTANYKGTLLDFLLEVYAPLGITEDRFVFRASTARNLRTGKPSDGGPDPSVRLERLKPEQARVQVGESIYQAADRHLRRFGLMHWDGPDDTIVVGSPNQGQAPIYDLRLFRDRRGAANNIIAMTRVQDWSQAPSAVVVHGGRRGGGRPMAIAVNQELTSRGIVRPVVLLADSIRNDEAAANAAHRELASRLQDTDVLQVETDGLCYLDPETGYRVPWSVDTVASINSDLAGGDLGAYYVPRLAISRSADQGDRANLSLIRAGLWQLYPDAFEGRIS